MLETLLRYLKHKRLLLILDNCEHVIEEVAKIADAILRGSPDVRLLATSREPLRIAGEYVYRMPSLAFPSQSDTLTAEDALSYGAVALFAQRAAASDARFKLTDENAPVVAEICRRLDGIALAIELAAARVKVLAPRQLAEKLDKRFRVLTGGSRTALPRQQTMRALIDWSHDLLSAKEQKLFRRLAIFVGGWALETAGAVCADEEAAEDAIESWEVLDLLSSLVEKSLVHAEQMEGGMRYRSFGVDARVCARTACARPERTLLLRKHTRLHFSRSAKNSMGFLKRRPNANGSSGPSRSWRTSARRSPGRSERRAMCCSAGGWRPRSDRRGRALLRPRDSVGFRRRVIGPPPRCRRRWRPHSTVPRRRSLRHLLNRKRPASEQNALWRSTASLAIRLRVAQARHLLGRALVDLGQVEEGEKMLTCALKEARATGVRSTIGDILQSLAIARSHAGDLAGARPLFAEALAMFRSVGAERVCSHIAGNLAEAEFHEGNAAEALRLENEALATYRTFNHKLGVAISLCNIAAYLIALERYEDACISARDGLAAARDTQWEAGVLWGLQHLAATAALRPADDAEHVRGDRLGAARLLGYVDARLDAIEALRQHTEQQEHDKMLTALRDALGENQLARLMAEGAAWSEDQAVAEALAI